MSWSRARSTTAPCSDSTSVRAPPRGPGASRTRWTRCAPRPAAPARRRTPTPTPPRPPPPAPLRDRALKHPLTRRHSTSAPLSTSASAVAALIPTFTSTFSQTARWGTQSPSSPCRPSRTPPQPTRRGRRSRRDTARWWSHRRRRDGPPRLRARRTVGGRPHQHRVRRHVLGEHGGVPSPFWSVNTIAPSHCRPSARAADAVS